MSIIINTYTHKHARTYAHTDKQIDRSKKID